MEAAIQVAKWKTWAGVAVAAAVVITLVLAFTSVGSTLRGMVFGDLVLTADQVGPGASAASALGVALTRPVGTTWPDDFFIAAGSEVPVPVAQATVNLTISSRYGHPVTIDEIHVEIVEQSDPLAGTLFVRDGAASSSANALVIAADGDRQAHHPDGTPYFPGPGGSAISIEAHQSVTLSVVVTSVSCLCHFVIAISSIVDGSRHTKTVPDRDHPLVVTGLAPTYGAMYLGIPDGWEAVNRSRLCSQAPSVCP